MEEEFREEISEEIIQGENQFPLGPQGPGPFGPGPVGPQMHVAGPGFQFLQGDNGTQDTFVFTLGDGVGAGTPFNPANIESNANSGMADIVMDFNRSDGDKIKLMNGATPVDDPITANATLGKVTIGMGTAVYVLGSSEVVFVSPSSDVSDLSDADFTTV